MPARTLGCVKRYIGLAIVIAENAFGSRWQVRQIELPEEVLKSTALCSVVFSSVVLIAGVGCKIFKLTWKGRAD